MSHDKDVFSGDHCADSRTLSDVTESDCAAGTDVSPVYSRNDTVTPSTRRSAMHSLFRRNTPAVGSESSGLTDAMVKSRFKRMRLLNAKKRALTQMTTEERALDTAAAATPSCNTTSVMSMLGKMKQIVEFAASAQMDEAIHVVINRVLQAPDHQEVSEGTQFRADRIDTLRAQRDKLLRSHLAMIYDMQHFADHEALVGLPEDALEDFQLASSRLYELAGAAITWERARLILNESLVPVLPRLMENPTKQTDVQRLYRYVLEMCRDYGLRRMDGQCYRERFIAVESTTIAVATADGAGGLGRHGVAGSADNITVHRTHAWEKAFEMSDFVKYVTRRETQPDMNNLITKGPQMLDSVVRMLCEYADDLFPDLERDDNLFSTCNGILCINPKDLWFAPYGSERLAQLAISNPNLATRKFIECTLDERLLSSRTAYEMMICVPNYRHIQAVQRKVIALNKDGSDPVDWESLRTRWPECEAATEEIALIDAKLNAPVRVDPLAGAGGKPSESETVSSTLTDEERRTLMARRSHLVEMIRDVQNIGADMPEKRGELVIDAGMMGRTLFKLGTHDNDQIFPALIGQPRSGKGTILKCRQHMDELSEVEVIGDNLQDDFQLDHIDPEKTRVCIAPDIRRFKMDMGTFLSIVSMDPVTRTMKNKRTETIPQWTVPMIIAANVVPEAFRRDPTRALLERTVLVTLEFAPKQKLPNLTSDLLKHELANVLYIWAWCYRALIADGEPFTTKFSQDMWDKRDALHKQVDPWYGFLSDPELFYVESRMSDEEKAVENIPLDEDVFYVPYVALVKLFRTVYQRNKGIKPPAVLLQEHSHQQAMGMLKVNMPDHVEVLPFPSVGRPDAQAVQRKFAHGIMMTPYGLSIWEGRDA